ncbi:MAG: helix-turn-helix domain-containing protein [Cetobacterium sp.]
MKQSKLDEIQNNLTKVLQITEINISKNCKKAKLSRNTHHRLIKNKNEIYLKTFFKIATFLNIRPADLLSFLINESELKKLGDEVTFLIDTTILSTELKNGMNRSREIGKSIEYLFFNDNRLIDQRQFSYLLAGKGFSLKSFLIVCEILEIDSIEIIKKITKEEKL